MNQNELIQPVRESDTSFGGLSSVEAAERLRVDGPNALSSGQRRTWFVIMLDTAREPMFLLLFAAGTLYLIFGELLEGLILFGFVLMMLGLTLYQEGKDRACY